MTDGRPLLGAAIIVKNEAHHLRRCLPSLHGLCDEVVLVDTGSTDESVDVALAHGATVLHRPWDNDFSAARNRGLDHLRARWVLYIDADEEVQPCDVTAVRRAIDDSQGVAGYMVKFAARVGWTPYWEYRIWRHRDDVRFRGRIHETVVPDLRRLVRDEGQRFERIDVFFQHYGYEGDQTAKHHRNLPMLLEQIEISPRRVYLWNHLGRVYDGIGQPAAAEAAWQQGIDLVREHGLVEGVDMLVYGSMALHKLRLGEDITDLVEEGFALDPKYYTLHLANARRLMLLNDQEAAEATLRMLIEVGRSELDHPVLAFSREIFERLPMEMLAECLFEQGRYREAAASYEAAMAFGADPLAMRTKAIASRSMASDDETLSAK